MDYDFKMSLENLDGKPPILQLEGEANVYTAPQIKIEIISLVESKNTKAIVDLTKVTYLDSTTLGVLIGGLKRFRDKDGDLVLVCPSPRILRAFEITGLDKIFDIFNSVEDAISSIDDEPPPPAV
jgi:anti-sigma B factor antagonist